MDKERSGREGWQDPSFDAFVAQSSTRLLRIAFLLSGDRYQAEDLLQTALVRTGRRWSAASSAPEAYAGRVLINLLHDRHRRLRRRPQELPLTAADEWQTPTTDLDEAVLDRDAILTAIRTLSTRQQEVVVLRYFADLSVQDTAAVMGSSPGSVKTQTSRALTHLRKALEAGRELQARTGVPNAD